MCPDRKLKWFRDHGHSPRQVTVIKQKVIQFWEERYKQYCVAPTTEDAPQKSSVSEKSKFMSYNISCNISQKIRSRYAPEEAASSQHGLDHIRTYLEEPVIQSQLIKDSKGYMAFWNNAMSSRPSVARMASDICSAPGQ